ncbi:MAG: TraB/GumN family protein [Clostridia bacterium]|nr:TraB/GumN family protein [Clostridia bacterium]
MKPMKPTNNRTAYRCICLLLAMMITLCVFTGCGAKKPEQAPADTEETADAADISPLLWRVTDGRGGEMYLFGTIHAGDDRNDTVIERLSPYLDECENVAVEFDIVAYQKDLTQMMVDMKKYFLFGVKRINDILPEETYEKAKELLKKSGTYLPVYDEYGPALWSQLVDNAVISDYSGISTENAIDTKLINYAYDHGMPVLDIESASFQSSLLARIPDSTYIILIDRTVSDPEGDGARYDALYESWLAGNEDKVSEALTEEFSEEYTEEEIALLEDYDKILITDRNVGMADKAEEYLASGEKTFFAVGTGHVLYEDGLVDLLTERGYTVERVEWN